MNYLEWMSSNVIYTIIYNSINIYTFQWNYYTIIEHVTYKYTMQFHYRTNHILRPTIYKIAYLCTSLNRCQSQIPSGTCKTFVHSSLHTYENIRHFPSDIYWHPHTDVHRHLILFLAVDRKRTYSYRTD